MKKIKYILMFIFSSALLTSCIDNETGLELNDKGLNVVTFDRIVDHLTGVAETGGAAYSFLKKIKLVGPGISELTSDIVVNVEVAEGTTADGTMYRINNLPLTLTASNNYLGQISITLTTLGNEPPLEGDPGYDSYVAPKLNLKLVATGDAKVVGSGKIGQFTLNFTPPNPWAGDYEADIQYRRPGDGATGVYPNNLNGNSGIYNKTLVGLTANRLEVSSYAVFEYGSEVLSWVTINKDNLYIKWIFLF